MDGATINVRNVNYALPRALKLLGREGVWKDSRNGKCIQHPGLVVTEYRQPWERVLYCPERDANPFFHLYESIWMLAGRNDVASVANFAKQMLEYSDNGETLHGAYGYRWINHFIIGSCAIGNNVRNQLGMIVRELKENPDSRRAVLQMWDPEFDLGYDGKDVPCNLTATFQILDSKLEMVVFCRSNDIIWGAYGANVVHFSMLQEYLAVRIGIPMGNYTQVSVNWHAYENQYNKLLDVDPIQYCLYSLGHVDTVPMQEETIGLIPDLLIMPSHERPGWPIKDLCDDPFAMMFDTMMYAHNLFKTLPAPERFNEPLAILSQKAEAEVDWCRAGYEWIARRYRNWERRMRAK